MVLLLGYDRLWFVGFWCYCSFLLLLINPGFHFDNFFLYRVLNYMHGNKYLTRSVYKV
jgi:hypothetical protein